jgi:cobalt-zinc-cadmium efflux system membrane fusion protein
VPSVVQAHDEHEALPSKGASVYKNLVLITPQAEQAIGLEKAKIKLADWREEVVVNATVDVPCTRHAYASSLVSGKIDELLVRPGDDVQAGQVLARVRSLELETLESQLLQVSAEHDLAARTLDQRESLARGGALPQRDLFLARATYREKAAELALLMAKLRAIGFSPDMLTELILSKELIRSLPVVSPIEGSVSLADARIGQTVDPTDHIFHLVDRSGLVLVGEVLESDVWRVRAGMPVRVVLASFPEEPLEAKLEHVCLKLDDQRRTMEVRAEMPNRDGRIRPGMFGRMHIEVARTSEAVVCPAEALIRHANHVYVLREQGRNHGKYVLTRVVIGSRDDGRVEIVDGLFPGQRVLTVGTLELASLLNEAFAVADEQADSSSVSGPAAILHAAENASLPTASHDDLLVKHGIQMVRVEAAAACQRDVRRQRPPSSGASAGAWRSLRWGLREAPITVRIAANSERAVDRALGHLRRQVGTAVLAAHAGLLCENERLLNRLIAQLTGAREAGVRLATFATVLESLRATPRPSCARSILHSAA